MTDSELLEWYTKGWYDECWGNSNVVPPEAERAYNMGASDFIVGDDVRSVDYQTDEEILKRIKGLEENLAEENVLIQNELENLTIEWLSDRKESLYITQGEDTTLEDGTHILRRILLERDQIAKFCDLLQEYK